jgi:hypothetical protein
MADFENATPFGARAMPSCDREGRDVLLIVVGAQFDLPEPGYDDPRLRLCGTQEPPPLADEYFGEPGRSSIRREGQSSYTKPATDIYVWGEACAPKGEPVTEMIVNIRVGPCAADLRVRGDRAWQRAAIVGARPSDPAPFVTMPLVWERAYGGVAAGSTERRPAFEPRNPIGCGFESNSSDAIGKPLPNIEDPRQPLSSVSDRPRPMGAGPIARHWQPRVSYAGTYDDTWKRQRAPLWPTDFDERFFCGAPGYLQAFPHLTGGEHVILQGLHPVGPIRFLLPTLRMVSRSRFVDKVVRTTPVLDGVLIETDVGRLTMYYRAAVPAPLTLIKHRETLLRLLGPGEDGTPR